MKRAVAAAAATAGLTVGALAMATPAMAAGSATYNCGSPYTSVAVGFDKDASGRLLLTATLNPKFQVPSNNTVITASLDGSTSNNPTKTLNAGLYSSITMTSPTGPYGTVSSAPSNITLTITGASPISCNYVSGATGFPV